LHDRGPEASERARIDDRLMSFLRDRHARGLATVRTPGSVTVPVWFHVINQGSGAPTAMCRKARSMTRSPC
jgi:hypothetical protein